MPTEVIHTLRASGGDYSLISTWEAAQQRDLVAADEVAILECYNDWPSGLNDSVDINGWTTDATRKIIVRSAAGQCHDGTPGYGFYISKSLTWGKIVRVNTPNVLIQGIEARNTAGAGSAFYCGLNSWSVLFDRCIGQSKGGTGEAAFYLARESAHNCLARGVSGAGQGYGHSTGGSWYGFKAYNCVAEGLTYGFGVGNGASENESADKRNCVAYGCTTGYIIGSGHGASTNNAASDGATNTPPGTSPYTSNVASGDFEDTASKNFHLASGSGLIGKGANLYTSLTVDVDGDEWPASGAWDIGFDHFVGIVSEPVQPPQGVISSDGGQPSVAQQVYVLPSAGQFATVGYTPDVVQITPTDVFPQSATINLVGQSPWAEQPRLISPPSASINVTGSFPSSLQPRTLGANAALCQTHGALPSLAQPRSLTPSSAALAIEGTPPVVSQLASIQPTRGALTLLGHEPAIDQSHSVSPWTADIKLSGSAPLVSQPYGSVVSPTSRAVDLSGNPPAAIQPRTVAPVKATASIAGGSPAVSQLAAIRPISGSYASSGVQIALSQPMAVSPVGANAAVRGKAPAITLGTGIVNPINGAMLMFAAPPSIVQPRTFSPEPAGLSVRGNQVNLMGAMLRVDLPRRIGVRVIGPIPSVRQVSGDIRLRLH